MNLLEARDLSHVRFTEEQRRLLEENDEIIDMTAEDILNDIRDGALFDMEKGKSLNDLIEACEKEKIRNDKKAKK